MSAVMRAKLKINSIEIFDSCERLKMSAVSGKASISDQGSDEDNNYARWSPQASFEILIANPALHGQFKVGEAFYVDFTKAEK